MRQRRRTPVTSTFISSGEGAWEEPGVKLNWDATLVNKVFGSRIAIPLIMQ